jgi:hypothetical protein
MPKKTSKPVTAKRGSDNRAPRKTVQPSAAYSSDPILDPAELFDVLEREENLNRVLAAMREFHRRDDGQLFARAVAVFVRSARARGDSIEKVLATLDALADELERNAAPGFSERDTPMRHLVLRGVLLAFYGSATVERERVARAERRARQRQED